MLLKRKRVRRLLLLILGTAIVAEIVALTPTRLEDPKSNPEAADPTLFVQDLDPILAPGIPRKRIAEYSVEKFRYVSVNKGEKQWRIEAETAFLYHPEQLVHARNVTAYLYDANGKTTIVSGLEAKYFLNQRDLEMFGQVKTLFPDGFEVNSEYLRYLPTTQHIEIPTRYLATGSGHEEGNQLFHFSSKGLDYFMGKSQVHLLENVKVSLEKNPEPSKAGVFPLPSPKPATIDTSVGVPNLTTIESDHCLIYRDQKLAKFTMNPYRPTASRFVHITQPTLFTKARRADLHYGDFSQVLQYLTAYDDVFIRETGEGSKTLRYATGGQADFDTHRDVIVISEFPQVYQDQDTVTGEVILMHRDTGIIEIEHSNAFSTGKDAE